MHETRHGLEPQHLRGHQPLPTRHDDKSRVPSANQQRLHDPVHAHRLDQRPQIGSRSRRLEFNLPDWQHANRLAGSRLRQLVDVMAIRTHPVPRRQPFTFADAVNCNLFYRSIRNPIRHLTGLRPSKTLTHAYNREVYVPANAPKATIESLTRLAYDLRAHASHL